MLHPTKVCHFRDMPKKIKLNTLRELRNFWSTFLFRKFLLPTLYINIFEGGSKYKHGSGESMSKSRRIIIFMLY